MSNENKYPSGGSGPGLQTVVIRKGMAGCTDRIGGAGVVTHGVVGVATQDDALQAENERLRHDLERQMSIANEQVNEAERLREALAHIAFSGADGPYGHFGEALNEYQMRSVAKAALERSE